LYVCSTGSDLPISDYVQIMSYQLTSQTGIMSTPAMWLTGDEPPIPDDGVKTPECKDSIAAVAPAAVADGKTADTDSAADGEIAVTDGNTAETDFAADDETADPYYGSLFSSCFSSAAFLLLACFLYSIHLSD
jgi:hypothetical protein